MATKPAKDKAQKPAKDKAKRPAKTKAAVTPTLPVEPVFITPEPQRDTYAVAFCIIATPKDVTPDRLQLCLSSLPDNAQVCILLNSEGPVEYLSEIDVDVREKQTIRSREWKFPKGTFDFAKARNLCQDMATKEWAFWIDCDELLCAAQHDGIEYAVASHGGGVGGFNCGQASMTRYTQLASGKDPEYINIKQLRLYRLGCGFTWEGYAHEQIAHSIRGAGYSVVDTSITVVHNGYSQTDAELIARLNRNADLIGKWLHEKPKDHPLAAYYKGVYVRELSAIQNLEKPQ